VQADEITGHLDDVRDPRGGRQVMTDGEPGPALVVADPVHPCMLPASTDRARIFDGTRPIDLVATTAC
jgi:hypothetical protein